MSGKGWQNVEKYDKKPAKVQRLVVVKYQRNVNKNKVTPAEIRSKLYIKLFTLLRKVIKNLFLSITRYKIKILLCKFFIKIKNINLK